MTPQEARERVAKGAAHLDRGKPRWAWAIDPRTLDLTKPCLCVLGQVFGSYNNGLEGLPNHQGAPFGFDVTAEDYGYGSSQDMYAAYRRLQDAWIEAIADRLMAPVPVVQEQVR